MEVIIKATKSEIEKMRYHCAMSYCENSCTYNTICNIIIDKYNCVPKDLTDEQIERLSDGRKK